MALIKLIFNIVKLLWEPLFLIFLFIASFISRFSTRKIDIGLGPEPLINNIYHKKALELYGYKSETFVTSVYFITSEFDKKYIYPNRLLSILLLHFFYIDFLVSLFSYKCLYIYFNGSSLSRSRWIWRCEPILLALANIKTVVMPYGSDVQVFDKTPNLYFRNCAARSYPMHKLRHSLIGSHIKMWSTKATHVIAGCDWVDYLFHWDTLMVAHFSIEMPLNESVTLLNNDVESCKRFKILHAPNHREIKGTKFVIEAVKKLNTEGFDVELILAEKKSNIEILELIKKSDLVIDQLVVGWYAMFAIESMAHQKPEVCFLRDDLLSLYRTSGLIKLDDPPLFNSNPIDLYNDLKFLILNKNVLNDLSKRGYKYVQENHSIESVGFIFDQINKSIGVEASGIVGLSK